MFKKLPSFSEFSLSCGKIAAGLLVLSFLPAGLRANPAGGTVAAGQANIQGGAGSLTVNQLSQRAIINWQDFSIQQGEITRFVQPNSGSAVLNRVVGSNLSSIYGTLQANGQVYLINPNGIVIGPSGVVNTAGFVASTLDVDNGQFLAGGDLTFRGSSSAMVVNAGRIGASEHDVILIAQRVENIGEIRAPGGHAALAAGNEVLVKAAGQERIFVRAGRGQVTNKGLIDAAKAELKAAGGNEYALAINNSGVVRATGGGSAGGRILLQAGSAGSNRALPQVPGNTVVGSGSSDWLKIQVGLNVNSLNEFAGLLGDGGSYNFVLGNSFQIYRFSKDNPTQIPVGATHEVFGLSKDNPTQVPVGMSYNATTAITSPINYSSGGSFSYGATISTVGSHGSGDLVTTAGTLGAGGGVKVQTPDGMFVFRDGVLVPWEPEAVE